MLEKREVDGVMTLKESAFLWIYIKNLKASQWRLKDKNNTFYRTFVNCLFTLTVNAIRLCICTNVSKFMFFNFTLF